MVLRRLLVPLLMLLALVLGGIPVAGSAAAAPDPCYFIVKIPAGSTTAPATLPAIVRSRIAACVVVMKQGYTRVALRVGRSPSSTDLAWQAAILKEFVRNGCTDIRQEPEGLPVPDCEVFTEKYPYGYAGKVAKPGTVIVFGFEPI